MKRTKIMVPERKAWANAVKNLVRRGEITREQEERILKRLNKTNGC